MAGKGGQALKGLLTTRDKITLFWFASAAYTLYRYIWERPMSVATFATIASVAIYAVLLIGLNETGKERRRNNGRT